MVTMYSAQFSSVSGERAKGNAVYRCILFAIVLLGCLALASVCWGQVTIPAVPTGRMDNQRTAQNIYETILNPTNVNSSQFGALFSYPTDYQALAQPLYVPGVTINGAVHNVVYVATMADSVYAFDADSNLGGSSAPCSSNPSCLWQVNFTDPANGITLASIYSNTSTGVGSLPCAGNGSGTVGFFQEGIAGTPVIDTVGGTLYVVAKTLENGTVVHRLHALDITSGAEKFGYTNGVVITASSTYVSPVTGLTYKTNFNSLHQLNRPGLLFLSPGTTNNNVTNPTVYMAFGSNSCNDDSTGWVLAYNAGTLTQTAVFNDSPQHGLASIWQTGNGIAADEFGNIFVETAETCVTYKLGSQYVPCYDVNQGGATFSNSILQLNPNTLTLTAYFTPYDVAFLNANDEDLSSTGVLILPDQDGLTPHELVASGKQGFIYVLNRDNMGGNDVTCAQQNPTCDNVLQEFPLVLNAAPTKVKDLLFSSPAYWNGNVYFTPDGAPVSAYPILPGGLLGTPVPSCSKPPCTTANAQNYVGAHSASVSASGSTNGVLWAISGTNLDAFNATTMQLLYSSSQNKTRDALPLLGHFATQTVVNGKVYVATAATSAAPTAVCTVPPCPAQLSVYGLLTSPTLYSGGHQAGVVATPAAQPIQIQVVNPYTGAGINGLTVTFSAKSGTFTPSSAVSQTNSSGVSGIVSTNYTFPTTAGTITITATLATGASVSFTETAVPGTPTKLVVFSGNSQSGQAGSILPNQLVVKVEDVHSNVVPGFTVTFLDQKGLGTLGSTSGVSNASGVVTTSYQLPNTPAAYKVVASSVVGTKTITGTFTETSSGDAPASVVMISGSSQTAAINTALSQPLVVQVNDSGGNPIPGVSVVFSAPSGTFTGSPATTNSSGQATINYTTGTLAGSVNVTAAVNKLNAQIPVTVIAGSSATVTVSGGNNQTGTAGASLSQALSVVVTDQYGNPVSGVSVTFSDGGAGGSFSSPNPTTTNSSGQASETYTLSPIAGPVTITATAAGATNPATFSATSASGPAAVVNITGGTNQTAPAGTQLLQPLSVEVTDQYGNPVAGVNVSFNDNGAGGTFSNPNPVATNSSGTASQMYTLPAGSSGLTIYINATAAGVTNPVVFRELSE